MPSSSFSECPYPLKHGLHAYLLFLILSRPTPVELRHIQRRSNAVCPHGRLSNGMFLSKEQTRLNTHERNLWLPSTRISMHGHFSEVWCFYEESFPIYQTLFSMLDKVWDEMNACLVPWMIWVKAWIAVEVIRVVESDQVVKEGWYFWETRHPSWN